MRVLCIDDSFWANTSGPNPEEQGIYNVAGTKKAFCPDCGCDHEFYLFEEFGTMGYVVESFIPLDDEGPSERELGEEMDEYRNLVTVKVSIDRLLSNL